MAAKLFVTSARLSVSGKKAKPNKLIWAGLGRSGEGCGKKNVYWYSSFTRVFIKKFSHKITVFCDGKIVSAS